MAPDTETFDGNTLPEEEVDRDWIDRGDTGRRVLLTVLFAVIWSVAETVLAVIVVFSLIWALVTQGPPPPRLREFANRLLAYSYRIWRYVSYGDARVPFPFSEFPEALEPLADLGHDEGVEVREHWARSEDDSPPL